MFIRKAIKKSPWFIQKPIRDICGLVPYNKRFGNVFYDTYKLLNESQYWTKDQLYAYQVKQMKKLLKHSYKNVPYYNKLFNQCGFDVEKFNYLDDINKIPFLTKDLVMKNIENLKAKNFNKSEFVYSSTGGTTGKQMKFYVQNNFSKDREWAFMFSQWDRMGFDYKNSKRVILRNQVLPKNKLWVWDNYQKALIVDTYHLTDENIKKIIDKLNLEKIPFIHTYPSAITIICDYIKRTEYSITYPLKCILASSENIYSGQRDLIENILNTRMFSWYGHSEQCILAGECEYSNKYHIFSEYGYTELIDNNGNVINENGIRGELVGTSFNNYAMPFIRYKTADYACYSKDQNCKCGRNYKLLDSVEGRWLQEMIITSKGNKISITALNMHSDIFDNVKNFQFYQDTPGICILNIIKKDGYKNTDERKIYNEVKKKLGEDTELRINYVNEIPRTKSGKYRYLIQKIN